MNEIINLGNGQFVKVTMLKGERGSNIASIAKTSTDGLVDTYTITLTDGHTTTFQVTNGANIGVANLGYVQTSNVAQKAFSVGEHLVLNDQYCVVTQAIAQGDSIVMDTNVKAETIGDEITELDDRKADKSQINQLASEKANLSALNSEIAARSVADANLQSQINQIVAPSGEAPSAAEVENARIGANGVTYSSLGDAIRNQITELDSNISDTKKQIISYDSLFDNSFNVSKNISASSETFSTALVFEKTGIVGGSTIQFVGAVKATINPSVFTFLTFQLIEFDTNNTVVTRTTIQGLHQNIVTKNNTTSIKVYVLYSHDVTTAYSEVFNGYVLCVNNNILLKDYIDVPFINKSKADIIDFAPIFDDSCIIYKIISASAESNVSALVFEKTGITGGSIIQFIGSVVPQINPSIFSAVFFQVVEFNSSGTVLTRTTITESYKQFALQSETTKIIVYILYSQNGGTSYTEEFNVNLLIAKGDISLKEYIKVPSVIDLEVNIKNEINSKMRERLKYNDLYYKSGILRRCYNPYKNGGTNLFAGQLHCHMRYKNENDEIVYYNNGTMAGALQNYLDAGYDFMVITDYGHIGELTIPNSADIPQGLLWMCNSCEADFSGSSNPNEPKRHMCIYNTGSPISYRGTWISAQDYADIAKHQGKIITLAHPFYTDTYQPPEVVAQIKNGIRFCEVYNGLEEWHESEGDDWITLPSGKDTDYAWEIMLDNGVVTWGIAVSDAHTTTNLSFIKNGCVKVFCDEKSRFDIIKNLSLGNFYAVSNIDISLQSLSFENGLYSINVGQTATIEFIKENGVVVSTTNGTQASYQMTGEEKYIRAKVTLTNGEKIWTQPIINIFEPAYDNYFDYSLINEA